MKLFYAPNSPFARKCRVVIREKELVTRVQEVVALPFDNPPELVAANPLATVPTLVTDSSRAFCDSPLICEYLDGLESARPSLFPAAGSKERWDVLSLAALADGVMDAAVHVVLEGRKPEAQRSASWIARKEEAVSRGIALIAHHRFMVGVKLDISIIAVLCALDYVRFRLPHLDWQGQHAKLAEWMNEELKRSAFVATAPQP